MKYTLLKQFNDGCIWKLLVRRCSITVVGSKSGNDNFQNVFDKCHLETNKFQKTLLGVGSAIVSLADPRRGDMIAALGETTGRSSLEYVKSKMSDSNEGKRILQEKPRISTNTVDLTYLSTLKDETVGKAYYNFLRKYNYTPDARLAVRFVDDYELAYVIQRYREVHDLFHTILNMPTNMLGEVTVKWVEAVQTRLPMCIGGALFGAARLAPKFSRQYSTQHKPSFRLDSIDGTEKNNQVSLRLPCVEVPAEISSAIKDILQNRNLSNLNEKGKYMYNYLRSRSAPLTSEDLRLKKLQCKAEVHNEFPSEIANATSDEQEYSRKFISSKVDNLLRSRLYHWKPIVFDDQLSFHYLAGRASVDYAVVSKVLHEIHQRHSSFAPKSLFDFGSGIGSVSWVAHKFWGRYLNEYFTVDCSSDMNDLARLILQLNKPQNNPFIKNLFQRQFLPTTPRKYDLVVSSYSLIELDSMKSRADILLNLWAKTAKYLVIIEQGTNAGFKLVQEARDLVLHASQNVKEECHIFSPCPHEMICPRMNNLQSTPCNFMVRYKDSITASMFSTTERFCFVIIKKGSRKENDHQWPRVVRDVLHRHKHTLCRLCTKHGKLDEIIVTKSRHGKDAYKYSRQISWGDLMPVDIGNESNGTNT